MNINYIHIKNYRGLRDVTINLEGNNTVIFGVNGVGKTSILNACSNIFTKTFYEAAQDRQIEVEPFLERDITIGTEESTIELGIQLDGENYKVERSRDYTSVKMSDSIDALVHILEKKIGVVDFEGRVSLNNESLPIFVYYGINRYVRIPKYNRTYDEGGKLDAWRDNISSGVINIDKFSNWYRLRQEIENNEKINVNIEYEDKKLKFARQAILSVLGDDFDKIYYRVDENPSLILRKKGLEMKLDQLSDGEIGSTVLAGDIARRIAIANPNLDKIEDAEGVVLIDEIDLHLHPSWQEKIMGSLLKSFPNIQFIVTTHAPKVLNSLGDSVKIVSLKENDGEVRTDMLENISGWSANEILSRYMNSNPNNDYTKKLIDDLHDALDEKRFDDAKQLTDQLQSISASTNTEVVHARIVLGRNNK